MVEIRYGDYHEAADLAGLSVAEAREQLKDELGIPKKANAKLNGRKVSGKLESETCLYDEDKLTFTETRSNRGVFLAGALLLALAITGGLFAFTATTDTLNMVLQSEGEYVSVTDNGNDLVRQKETA